MIYYIAKSFLFIEKVFSRFKMLLLRHLFLKVGKNFIFNPNDSFTYHSISAGDDVYIGPGAKFSATYSKIVLGSKILIGPNVTIMGGDHNASIIGTYIYDVKLEEKRPEDDQPVIIEDDVWVGCGAIILKGVTIGQGAVIAAGAVVTHSIPPYSNVGGVPAKVIKSRFEQNDLLKHKKLIKKLNLSLK